MDRPTIKRCYRVETAAPDTVFLLAEDKHDILSGRIYANLAPLLDGTHTTSDLMAALSGIVSPPEIFYALNVLQQRGLLADAADAPPPAEAALWRGYGVEAPAARHRLARTSVRLLAMGAADATPLQQALRAMNVRLSDPVADLTVVVTDDYLQLGLDTINEAALATETPWLLVKLVGKLAWIGPLFVPGETGCWACMAQRIEGNRQVESYILRKTGTKKPLHTSRPGLPTTVHLAANMAATEIVKWITAAPTQQLQGRLVTLDMTTMTTQTHPLVRRPQCPACGDPDLLPHDREPVPLVLRSRKKAYMSDGGHRHLRPEETFARYRRHISPITGVISSLKRKENVGDLIHSYTAGHNFAMPRDDMHLLRKNLRSQSGGKGKTKVQAQVSGICEAMERYCGVYRPGTRYEINATPAEMAAQGKDPIDLRDCLLFSERQYANREEWNRQLHAPFHTVPNPYDETTPLDWTPIWSLTHDSYKYIPTVYCYYGHPDLKYFFCGSDSSGCAAGNTLEEAILQGFLELAERDGVAMWWYNEIPRPGVDLDSFHNDYFDRLRAFYREHNRSLWVLDISNDLGIPTFAAVSRREDHPVQDVLVGFGAHFDARLAILRALTEVNQYFPAVAQRNPDGSTHYWVEDKDARHWLQTATTEKKPYLAPAGELPRKSAADYPTRFNDDLLDDVNRCVTIADEAGLETLVLDQTLPDVGLSVCRVVVPGLRHFWRRLGPGRLYDVPVQLGWLDAPRREEDLNEYSLFF